MDELKKVFFKVSGETKTFSKEFTCDICTKYLTVSPILYNKSVGKVCGRCYQNGETEKYENVVFENQKVYIDIAKYFTFPCSYSNNGCKKELDWNEVKEHEDSCEFRNTKCPLSLEEYVSNDDDVCSWEGSNKDLYSHVLETVGHLKYFSNPPELSISASNVNNEIIFSEVQGVFIVIVLHYNTRLKLHFSKIFMDSSFSNCKLYKYDLQIFNENKQRMITFPGNSLEPLGDKILKGRNVDGGLELEFMCVSKMLGKANSLGFKYDIKKLDENIDTAACSTPQIFANEESFALFPFPNQKCKCGNFLFPPVSVCTNGHNGCETCKKTAYCKTCQARFLEGPNVALDTLTSLTKYSCRNESLGCKYVCEYKMITSHEENCVLTDKDCIMKCGWRGKNEVMYRHIRAKHPLIKLNHAYLYDGSKKLFPVEFEEHIFLLTVDFKLGTPLSVKLQCLGMQYAQYEYEFTLLSSCDNIKLTTCYFCQPLLFDENQKEILTPNIVYPFEFFKQFVTDYKQFEFKLNILGITYS